jgi:hypothetical protein
MKKHKQTIAFPNAFINFALKILQSAGQDKQQQMQSAAATGNAI